MGWVCALTAAICKPPPPVAEGEAPTLTVRPGLDEGLEAAGEDAAGLEDGGAVADWLVWTAHATNRSAVVAELVAATSTVRTMDMH